MAFKISTKGNMIANPTQVSYICDTIDDVQNLPKDVSWGATAFCIDGGNGEVGGKLFMLNSKGEWKEV